LKLHFYFANVELPSLVVYLGYNLKKKTRGRESKRVRRGERGMINL